MEQVSLEKPDIQGRGTIRCISINGLDVTSHDAVSTVGRFIYSLGDLKQVRTHVPCRRVLSSLFFLSLVGSTDSGCTRFRMEIYAV